MWGTQTPNRLKQILKYFLLGWIRSNVPKSIPDQMLDVQRVCSKSEFFTVWPTYIRILSNFSEVFLFLFWFEVRITKKSVKNQKHSRYYLRVRCEVVSTTLIYLSNYPWISLRIRSDMVQKSAKTSDLKRVLGFENTPTTPYNIRSEIGSFIRLL